MDCDDAEEARDLLRHKHSNVTRAIYRAHFGDRRRELLARTHGSAYGNNGSDGIASDAGRVTGASAPERQIRRGRE